MAVEDYIFSNTPEDQDKLHPSLKKMYETGLENDSDFYTSLNRDNTNSFYKLDLNNMNPEEYDSEILNRNRSWKSDFKYGWFGSAASGAELLSSIPGGIDRLYDWARSALPGIEPTPDSIFDKTPESLDNIAQGFTPEARGIAAPTTFGGKVIAGVSASGTPAVYDNTFRTLLDGCIYIWPFVKPNEFDTGIIYIPDDKISFDIDVFNSETNYLAGAETRFTGDGPLCQYHSYVAPTGQSPGPFDTGAWNRSGCATSVQFINTGITNIGPGDFSIDSGWQRATGETYLDTGCTVSWNHGMFTTPVQGHYVEGGGGNDILVWYDCEIMKGWNNIT